jgi:hypothetical protein
MRPPQCGQVSTGKPRVRRISSAHGQYRQRVPSEPHHRIDGAHLGAAHGGHRPPAILIAMHLPTEVPELHPARPPPLETGGGDDCLN